MESFRKSIFALFLLSNVVIIWGLNWPWGKILLNHIVAEAFPFLRLAIAFLFFFFFMLLTGRLKKPKKTDWPMILSIGMLQTGLYIFLIVLGLSYVDANRCAILAYITPLFVMPLSYFVLRQKPTLWKILGFIIGMGGVLIMFNPFDFDFSDRDNIIGNSLVIGGAFVWAIQIIFIKAYRHDFSSFDIMPWQLLTSAIFLSYFAFHHEPDPMKWFHDFNLQLFLMLLFVAIIGTGYSVWAAIKLNQLLDANTLSMCMLLVPVSGYLFSIWILGEEILYSNIIGLISIMCGILISTLDKFYKTDHDRRQANQKM